MTPSASGLGSAEHSSARHCPVSRDREIPRRSNSYAVGRRTRIVGTSPTGAHRRAILPTRDGRSEDVADPVEYRPEVIHTARLDGRRVRQRCHRRGVRPPSRSPPRRTLPYRPHATPNGARRATRRRGARYAASRRERRVARPTRRPSGPTEGPSTGRHARHDRWEARGHRHRNANPSRKRRRRRTASPSRSPTAVTRRDVREPDATRTCGQEGSRGSWTRGPGRALSVRFVPAPEPTGGDGLR